MKIHYFIIIIMIIMISCVSAEQQSLGLVKQNACVKLYQTCPSCTTITLTSILYPISRIPVATTIALTTSDNFYYSYSFCNTSILGNYIVNGIADVDGVNTNFGYDFIVTPNGEETNAVQISIYIIFLIVCLVLVYLSVGLIKSNRMADDKITDQKLYQMEKARELSYYVAILKRKLWIVGVFGVYLSILVFTILLSQIVYNLGLSDLNSILTNVVIIMSWGLIPFIVFWIAYIIIYVYKSTANILKYQFGSFRT